MTRSRPQARRYPAWFSRLFALLALLLASSVTAQQAPARVLFIGNSLTYVGNLPAVFDALSQANGRPTASDILAQGGATLTQRLNDGSAATAMATGDYRYVILQERGGDLIGGFGDDADQASRAAVSRLSTLARAHHASAVLLGSYQMAPAVSRALAQAEGDAARSAGIDYINVTQALGVARQTAPQRRWLWSDGGHPGPDLTLMEAMQLYRQLYGSRPVAADLNVSAPIYTPGTHLPAMARSDLAAAGNGSTAFGLHYTVQQISNIGQLLH